MKIDLINTINSVYSAQSGTVNEMATTITGQINIYAAIGAILYIFGNLLKQVYYSEVISILPYMRPFVILALIPLASTFSNGLDSFGESIRVKANGSSEEVIKRIESNSKKLDTVVEKKWEAIGNDEDLYKKTFGTSKSEDDSGMGLTDNINLIIGEASDDIKLAIVTIIQNLLIALMYIAEVALTLMAMMFKLMLRVGFPIAITLSIFPMFTNNLASWFGKYLNFCLLPAVAALYSRIAFGILDTYLDQAAIDINATLASVQTEAINPEFMGFAYIGILILVLIGYLFVPSMTSMLVSVGGVQSISAGITLVAAKLGSTSFQGAKGVASSQMQGAKNLGNAVAGAFTGGIAASGVASNRRKQGESISAGKESIMRAQGMAKGAWSGLNRNSKKG